jgi:thiamine biosynthesis lipoprotein
VAEPVGHLSRAGTFRVEHVMGMPVSVDLADDLPNDRLERLVDDTFAWLREVDARFSTYKVDSEVSRLAQGALRLEACSTDLRQVLDRCADLWRRTDGFFDVYAGGGLDPSGYVKGWAVQVASDRLVAAGSTNHCVNAAGDIVVRGGPRPGEPWRIGIQHPFQRMAVCWVLGVSDVAVATSGTYERGLHVIDPHTGQPAQELCSVTVVGPDLGTADAYATAALAMGLSGLDWLAKLDGHESAAITKDGRAFRSDHLPVVD